MPDSSQLLHRVSQSLSRRSFVGWMLASVPLARGVGAIRVLLLQPVQREGLDDALLLALASTVLPSELGAAGTRRACDEMQNWVRGYRPEVERNHAYGSARIALTGADPAPRWATQLRSLDSDARSAHGRAFAALNVTERRAIVRAQLTQEAATALPGDIAGARHVALAVLASFYLSPEATDLCYQARIHKNACRPLGTSSQRPLPLAPAQQPAPAAPQVRGAT